MVKVELRTLHYKQPLTKVVETWHVTKLIAIASLKPTISNTPSKTNHASQASATTLVLISLVFQEIFIGSNFETVPTNDEYLDAHIRQRIKSVYRVALNFY